MSGRGRELKRARERDTACSQWQPRRAREGQESAHHTHSMRQCDNVLAHRSAHRPSRESVASVVADGCRQQQDNAWKRDAPAMHENEVR